MAQGHLVLDANTPALGMTRIGAGEELNGSGLSEIVGNSGKVCYDYYVNQVPI